MSKTHYVVGDSFSEFCEYPNVITYSDIIMQDKESFRDMSVVVCQGLDEEEIDKLKALGINVKENVTKKVDKALAHKAKDENVLITTPVKTDTSNYESLLMVNDSCAEMSDHVTGKHLQGLMLAEAARQMFMACTELFDYDDKQKFNYGYILNNFDINFKAFLFPFDVNIKMKVLNKKWEDIKLHKAVEIEFSQKGIVGCVISASGTGFPKKILKHVEDAKSFEMYNLFCKEKVDQVA